MTRYALSFALGALTGLLAAAVGLWPISGTQNRGVAGLAAGGREPK